MSWQTAPFTLMLRGIGRKLGLNRLLASFLSSKEYEMTYTNELFKAVQTRDCIWDIGANIGHYTRLFSQQVGSEGNVFAFEPSPDNYIRLTQACEELENVVLLPFGLGEADKHLYLKQSHDELGATSRIVDDGSGDFLVSIRSAASVIASGIPVPNVIKIDVEGYEYEVLLGFSEILTKKDVRLIGIEVHFALLAERSLVKVPQQIETLLKNSGFLISWPDSSHIIAMREHE